jgi:hypothetical protein
MARFGTVAAAAILLFGTTFLGTGTDAEGSSWSVIWLLVLATLIGYAGAGWGLYKTRVWWRHLTIGASILGTVVLLVCWVAVRSLSGVTNLALHAIGIAVLLLLLVPSLGRGLDRRLTGHPRQGT